VILIYFGDQKKEMKFSKNDILGSLLLKSYDFYCLVKFVLKYFLGSKKFWSLGIFLTFGQSPPRVLTPKKPPTPILGI